MNGNARREAEIFGRYLLGKSPNEASIALYAQALEMRPVQSSARDEKLLRFALNNPWSIGMIDSALAFSKGNFALRKKLLIMSAILETQPEYAELFLPQERAWSYNIYIFWVGCRAVLKMLLGKILLLFI